MMVFESWGEWTFLPSFQAWIWVLRGWNNIKKVLLRETEGDKVSRIYTNLCKLFKVPKEKSILLF